MMHRSVITPSLFIFNNCNMWGLILVVIGAVAAGLAWAFYNFEQIKKIPIGDHFTVDQELHQMGNSATLGVVEIGGIIHEGASAFIIAEYKICGVFVILIGGVIWMCVDEMGSPFSTFSYVLGAITSMSCGAFGMYMATYSNYRTTICAKSSLGYAFKCAYRAGVTIGFTLVAISLLMLFILVSVYISLLDLEFETTKPAYYMFLFEMVAGFGLGGSSVALFARVGGGIFTKAADLGSDLVGKIQSGLPEDSPKNPATIADNVGDNVGDVAGMSADLFGSFAQALCAALVIGCDSLSDKEGVIHMQLILFVLLVPAIGLLVSLTITALLTEGEQITENNQVEKSLKRQLLLSTIALLPILWLVSHSYLSEFKFTVNKKGELKSSSDVFWCIALGLIGGLIIGYVTELMTSYQYTPVQELSEACKTGPATNVIYGLALGYLSTIIPVAVLCLICYCSHSMLGYYGVSLGALGMLSNLPICLAIDSYGPVSDNAGGIAEMAELPSVVRERTDVLDSAGNTTAAIGKGFAIGSATLVGFALFGAFMHSAFQFGLKMDDLTFDNPLIFTCLLFGAMMPYAFSALTMKSVGKAALGMIQQVRRQIRENPGILDGSASPDYKSCVMMSTKSALKEMILPGLLVTCTPFVLGFVFGPKALIGFLPGAIVSGVQMGISHSNTGGAWDNAKKYIEAGLVLDRGVVVVKGSEIHKAAVIGDTVGDPMKDTSGPSLNILIKLMAILSLVFCKYFSSS